MRNRILRLSLIIILMNVILLPLLSEASSLKRISDVILKKTDMPAFTLQNQVNLSYHWSVVKSIPDYMKNPENLDISTNPLDPPMVLKKGLDYPIVDITKKDGIRQNWLSGSTPGIQVAVEYGQYDTPLTAQNSLRYLVYNRVSPVISAVGYTASCRRLNYGDLSYFVSAPTGGGLIYFTKGNYIFMVDSVHQSLQDEVVKIILQKFEEKN
jgi:hypothetical protein